MAVARDCPIADTRFALIRIFCVDDHRIVREGIASLIDRQPDMRVVASAASGEEAIDLFSSISPTSH